MTQKRYDQYGRYDTNGNYDAYGKRIKRISPFKKLQIRIHDYKQSKMIIPTDPIEIKRRADQIRSEIAEQKRQRMNLAELNKDLELIKFHARMNGRLEPDNRSYDDRRETSDTKERLNI